MKVLIVSNLGYFLGTLALGKAVWLAGKAVWFS